MEANADVFIGLSKDCQPLVTRERDREEVESGSLRPDVGKLELWGPSHCSGSVPMRSLSHFFIPSGQQSVCSDTR